MLYAVIFHNKREQLIIRAVEAKTEKEAISNVVAEWNKEYEGTEEEILYPLSGPRAVVIEPGNGIYHEGF